MNSEERFIIGVSIISVGVDVLRCLRVLKKFVLISNLNIPLEILFALFIYFFLINHRIITFQSWKRPQRKFSVTFLLQTDSWVTLSCLVTVQGLHCTHPQYSFNSSDSDSSSAGSFLTLGWNPTKQSTLCCTTLLSHSHCLRQPPTGLLSLSLPSKKSVFIHSDSTNLFCHNIQRGIWSTICTLYPVLWNPHSISFCH